MKMFKGILLSLAIAMTGGAGILAVVSLIIAKTKSLPQGALIQGIGTVGICLAVFVGSLMGALFSKEKGALVGGSCVLLVVCVLLLVSWSAQGIGMTISGGARLAAVFLSGCIGGILGVNRKAKVKF